MLIRVYRTSAGFGTVEATAPIPGAVLLPEEGRRDEGWFVEITTLEQLLEIKQKSGKPIMVEDDHGNGDIDSIAVQIVDSYLW
jgi:hypothetical protein